MRLDQDAEYPQPPEMGAGSEFCSRKARSVNREADKISRHSSFLLLHMLETTAFCAERNGEKLTGTKLV